MSYKPTPVTAKIQKTTKGGVCNPLLNVGTVAQMKAPSVANKKFSKDPKEKAKQKQWIKDNPEKYKELIAKKRKAEADSKARKEGEEGWAADDKARKDKTDIYADNKKNGNSGDVKKVVKKKAYADKSGKATKTKEVTTNNNTSQFTEKDSYIDQDRIKAIATGKTNAKPPKEEKKKLTKSQKLRAEGNAILADKSLSTEERQKKALKVRKRYDKQLAKKNKKKNKKQSFNAVTNQSGYNAFKKAGGLTAWSKGEIEVK